MVNLSAAFAASPSPMLVADARAPDHPILWANDAFLRQTGYLAEEVVGRNCRFLQGPETDRTSVAEIRQAIAAGRAVSVELLNYRKDGTRFWNSFTLTPVNDEQGLAFFVGAQVDTTLAHTNAERTIALGTALDRKTAMIHEIDHRAKNNLQVISSLLLLKARRTVGGETREALEGMAERIGALSVAHRLLCAGEDGSHFELTEFVSELVSEFEAGMADDRVRIDSDVDSVTLPASMAAPLALMLHELVANALRHAFPGGRHGRISIFAKRGEGGLSIAISDDGIGFDVTSRDETGFGRSLVEMVSRQLRGVVRWLPMGSGTRVEIAIPLREG
ncbi:PAS domain-containing protein [Methylobacterium sp. NFXW15]|uniref:PAS domain-containing protein n=1 Tax=Methylobacterium sp. NFXW15 TaxID=2819512 RepID=UPI003CEB06B3